MTEENSVGWVFLAVVNVDALFISDDVMVLRRRITKFICFYLEETFYLGEIL